MRQRERLLPDFPVAEPRAFDVLDANVGLRSPFGILFDKRKGTSDCRYPSDCC